MIAFDYIRSNSVDNAVSSSEKEKNAKFIAGGTNLIDLMKKHVMNPEKLIDITGLPLKQLEGRNNSSIYIGALLPNSELLDKRLINVNAPLIAQAVQQGASPQLRNMATVGGNIMQRTRCPYFYDITTPCNKREPGSGCSALEGYNRMHAIFGASEQCIAVHPSDMCVALAALDATVHVQGAKGKRTIPFTAFHRLPGNTPHLDNDLQQGELILGIEVPMKRFTHTHYLKVRDRASYAFALISVAVALNIKGNNIQEARIAMGGVAHKPWRLTSVEQFLQNKTVSENTFKQAAELAMQGAKAYKHNAFKLKLAPNSIVLALNNAVKSSS